MKDKCELCNREGFKLVRHHLVPRQKKGKGKNNYIHVCIPCSKQVHALFTNKELERYFNTTEKLKSSYKIKKWIRWIKDRKVSDINYSGKGGFHK